MLTSETTTLPQLEMLQWRVIPLDELTADHLEIIYDGREIDTTERIMLHACLRTNPIVLFENNGVPLGIAAYQVIATDAGARIAVPCFMIRHTIGAGIKRSSDAISREIETTLQAIQKDPTLLNECSAKVSEAASSQRTEVIEETAAQTTKSEQLLLRWVEEQTAAAEALVSEMCSILFAIIIEGLRKKFALDEKFSLGGTWTKWRLYYTSFRVHVPRGSMLKEWLKIDGFRLVDEGGILWMEKDFVADEDWTFRGEVDPLEELRQRFMRKRRELLYGKNSHSLVDLCDSHLTARADSWMLARHWQPSKLWQFAQLPFWAKSCLIVTAGLLLGKLLAWIF